METELIRQLLIVLITFLSGAIAENKSDGEVTKAIYYSDINDTECCECVKYQKIITE